MTTPTGSMTRGLTPEQESELRAILADARAANEADLRKAQGTLAALAEEGVLTDAAMHEVAASAEYMVEDASGILALIAEAEERLRTGAYGLCSTCGAPIPWERLLLRPYRSTCAACS